MSRKNKRKLLFGLKVLAIYGAAVFMVKGIDNLFVDARDNVSKKENANKIIEICETIIIDIAAETPLEKKEEAYKVKKLKENPEKIGSMNWDSEDAYLLAKIAMAEAEGEDVEGKALVILVVLNRVRSDKFPDTISEVIFQERQFSPVGNGRFDRVEPNRECYEALELIRLSQWDESQEALYFESEGKSSWHRNNLHFLFQHENHYFYTDKELPE